MDLVCYLPTDDAERYWDDTAQVLTPGTPEMF